MMDDSGFVAHVLDLLEPWWRVDARRMFGGYGLYRQGLMFALVADDTLYLKVDEGNRGHFLEAGMMPFTYEGKTRPVTLSYWETPPDALDDGTELIALAREAYAAATRARAASPPKPRRRR